MPQNAVPTVEPMAARVADLDERLAAVFKAYDVRGLVPDELDEPLAEAIGHAFVVLTDADHVVVGHDMRPSSPGLAAAFARGATTAGAAVTAIGLCATDQLYFAAGVLDVPGAMFTASHNPAGYNGIKMCRAGASPIGRDTGLRQIKELVAAGHTRRAATAGTVTERDMLADYAEYLLDLVPLRPKRRLRVVVDAGNGMAGLTVPAVLGARTEAGEDATGIEVVPLYFELDGTFPHHEANPIDPANLVDLQAAVRAEGADIGLAFDGDADRCFLVDERGEPVDPSAVTGLIAVRELQRHPGATIIHNLITSRAVPELIAEHGGVAVRTRVGHSFIKDEMARTGAVFGGEHSGHFYFREFWRADSGMLAALYVLAELGTTTTPLSELLAPYQRYVASGEINSEVADQSAVIDHIEMAWRDRSGVGTDRLDGLTVTHDDWWFNVRGSNTEPLLRLNCEGRDDATMRSIRDAVLTMIRRPDGSPR